MKYAINTLKYIKNNPLLIPCYLIAAMAVAALADPFAFRAVADSCADGAISGSYTLWLKFFLFVNPTNWMTILTGVAAYVVLILDLAFIHSLIDKHIRFGSKSFRSIASGFNINVVNSLILAVFVILAELVFAFLTAAIVKTFASISVPYVYVVGFVICAALAALALYASSLFMLWLPCVEVTGFKKFEALTYSYLLSRPRARGLFVSLAVPFALCYAACTTIELTCVPLAAFITVPLLAGAFFLYSSVLCYIAYAEAEGIEREDLKKY